MMYRDESHLQRVAYHEAAHVCLLFNAQRKFEFVTINPAPKYAKYGGYVYGIEGLNEDALAFQNAMISAAGMIGERMAYGDCYDQPTDVEHSDLTALINSVRKAYGSNDQLGFDEVVSVTNYVLKHCWFQVDKIAMALLQRGGLNYDECKAILEKY